MAIVREDPVVEVPLRFSHAVNDSSHRPTDGLAISQRATERGRTGNHEEPKSKQSKRVTLSYIGIVGQSLRVTSTDAHDTMRSLILLSFLASAFVVPSEAWISTCSSLRSGGMPPSSTTTTSLKVSTLESPASSSAADESSSASKSKLTYSMFNDKEGELPLGKRVTHEHCKDPNDADLLVRAAKGEQTERTPVWLMRQAGRYMAAFREYSDKIPFRERSETPEYAVELSLQCHRAYGMDGIIFFSDILTPLPVLGIDFDVIKGTGPVISTSIRTEEDVANLPRYPFEEKVPFVGEILGRLAREAKEEANASLVGFVGAPFTLAAYTIEGKGSKHCLDTKKLMMADEDGDNKCISQFLEKLSDMIGDYACYQIESGAQVIQIFESWAHQLSPKNFEQFAKPAAMKVIEKIRSKHPDTPIIYFANGGSSFLEKQKDMGVMIALDWAVDMEEARKILGKDVPVSGNIDPSVLFGSKQQIEQAVRDCIDKAGGPGNAHVLNLGHGVMQGTPEQAVQWLVDECKRYTK